MQLLIFRQDAPVISPHLAHLEAEPYRASGLVLWHKPDMGPRRLSVRYALQSGLSSSLLLACASDAQKPHIACFAVQLIYQACNRILARDIGAAGGNKQAMQRGDPVFASPFEIVRERQDRILKALCLPCRPTVFLLF